MQRLNEIIQSLDGKGVSFYTKLYGRYERNGIVYNICNVCGGPIKYAEVEIEVPSEALFGGYSYGSADTTAITNHIMREFSVAAQMANGAMQQSEANVQKGLFLVYRYSSRVLPNSVVKIAHETVRISLTVRLPVNSTAYNTGQRANPALGIKAQSGSILALTAKDQKASFNSRKNGIISAKALKLLLTKNLPSLAEDFTHGFDAHSLARSVELWQNQQAIRRYLKANGYVSFVANGSVLPRKGKTDYRDTKGVVPFTSPKSMEITVPLPSGETVSGMGIPCGITLITGDAYHGKSTILDGIREGVYDHVPGDGREYVITDSSAMAVQAEDGRSIRDTDISFFLRKLPVKTILPRRFSTENASGSTSQAAAVTEALESGCRLMLFDEDRSANNFMYKDEKMRSVIQNASTTPFIDNARMFYETHGISSVIVVGASGEYFRIADRVILVENFEASEYTDFEKKAVLGTPPFSPSRRRVDYGELRSVCLARSLEIKDDSTILLGREAVKVPEIIPHVTRGQLDFICSFLYYLTVIVQRRGGSLKESVMQLYKKLDADGLEIIRQRGFRGSSGVIEWVRAEDMTAILFRLKGIGFKE